MIGCCIVHSTLSKSMLDESKNRFTPIPKNDPQPVSSNDSVALTDQNPDVSRHKPVQAGQQVTALLQSLKPVTTKHSKSKLQKLTKLELIALLDAASIRYRKSDKKSVLIAKLAA